ncbi:PspC domain-containing protein [Brachybacterium sp. DNPG3]
MTTTNHDDREPDPEGVRSSPAGGAPTAVDDDLAERMLRAAVLPAGSRTPADRVAQGAPMRRPGDRVIAGVCAAIARPLGLPPALIRLIAVLLGLVGLGLPLYLLAALLLPRETIEAEALPVVPAGAPAVPAGEPAAPAGAPAVARPVAPPVVVRRIGTPWSDLREGRVRTTDALVLLALIPVGLLSLWWIVVEALHLRGFLGVLLGLAVVLCVVAVIAAHRGAEARRAFVLVQLARRAGIADDEQLGRFLLEQRRRAPWAWAHLAAGDARAALETADVGPDDGAPADSGPAGAVAAAMQAASAGPAAAVAAAMQQAPTSAVSGAPAFPSASRPVRPVRRRPRVPRATPRTLLAVIAGMLLALALTVLVLNLDPSLLPGLSDAQIAPQAGRLAAGFAAAAVVAGVALVVLGLRGRRSVALALVGIIALADAGMGAAWVRLTWDPVAEPYVIDASALDYGSYLDCPSTAEYWSRPIVIDFSGITAERAEELRAQRPADEEGALPIAVSCTPLVGDVEIRLPEDEDLVSITMATGQSWFERNAWYEDDPVAQVYGSMMAGRVTLVSADGTTEEQG